MGLQNQLTEVSSDSLPLLLLATIATAVTYLRSLILTVLHALHISNHQSDDVTTLILNRIPSYKYSSDPADSDSDCIVCLNRFNNGEHVRKLPCRHVFHKECVDGWIDHRNFNCPLCRSPVVVDDERVDVNRRRLTGDVIGWFAVRG
ncbi:E3 ubiquitin-protein ligase RHA2B-like [Bidens hawaiensis]|uniref:E3 ubiquitin-protein ligase RHA2B-like n=1 Tax=Bidens hawaiensis TaxID=980011 RepID=UPI00404A36EF